MVKVAWKLLYKWLDPLTAFRQNATSALVIHRSRELSNTLALPLPLATAKIDLFFTFLKEDGG